MEDPSQLVLGDGLSLVRGETLAEAPTDAVWGDGEEPNVLAVLSAVQQFMPELGIPPERIVFITGIGCAGRFAYYMDTYGMHGIHGRAPALATGLASAREDLSIWVVTGDGET